MELLVELFSAVEKYGVGILGWGVAALLWKKAENLTERLIKNHEALASLSAAVVSNTDTMKLLIGLIGDKGRGDK